MMDLLEPQLGEVFITAYEGDYDEDTGRYEGRAQITFDNGATYTGSLHDGLMHGKGTYLWAHGVKYEGDFQRGEMSGEGKYEWPDGSVYLGGVRNGLRHGHGWFENSVSQMYEGEWQEGRRHGRGRMTYDKAGAVWYEGYWEEGMRCGYGKMVYASGNQYLGQWVGDKKEGKGVMLWMDRSETYVGWWRSDLCEGLGEHFYDSHGDITTAYQVTNIYRGEFQEGLRNGYGTFFYSDGSQYSGLWSNNLKEDDQAVFVNADGRMSVGKYRNDRVIETYEKSSASSHSLNDFTSYFRLNIMDALLNIHGCLDVTALPTVAGSLLILQDEVSEIERIVLRFDSYLKGIYRHYRDVSNGDRLLRKLSRDAVQKSSFFDIDDMRDIDHFLNSYRTLDSRLFCMSYSSFIQFSREMKLLNSNFTLYDVQRCLFQMQQQQTTLSESIQSFHTIPSNHEEGSPASTSVLDSLSDSNGALPSHSNGGQLTPLGLLMEIEDPYQVSVDFGIMERDFVELLVCCVIEKLRRSGMGVGSGESLSRALQKYLTQTVTRCYFRQYNIE